MAEDKKNGHVRLSVVLSLSVIGFGVGWLVGLSVSPVVSIVITSVTATVAALVAAMSGIEEKPQWAVNPTPIAIFVAGLVVGSILGMWARSNDWLGRDVATEADAWLAAGIDLPRAEIVARIFAQQYPATGGGSGGSAQFTDTSTLLFSIGAEECKVLTAKQGSELRNELLSSTITGWQQLPGLVADDARLEVIIKEVLCAR